SLLSNIGDASATLPISMLAKGGAFISMYQREAMWMSFKLRDESRDPLAVKIPVGGVNALTGLPQNAITKGKQDYLPIGGEHGQLWAFSPFFTNEDDGISTSPGVVRQFVAMPLGKGYTVEGQVTGREVRLILFNVGGIQIDVFPKYDTTGIEFAYLGRNLNMCQTPRQLGLKVGQSIQLKSQR
ncbi:hypothetical protein PAXINDRAFT_86725, partial [Paxillus involutus ATCC 200175]